ncbi:MAG: methyltransferase domain-containing protein [Legionellales bacterium]|nr:methyltransferase domain-containing protein [Legionellales bacterium]
MNKAVKITANYVESAAKHNKLIKKAYNLYRRKELAKAKTIFQRLTKNAEFADKAYYFLGCIAQEEGNLDSGAQFCQRALQLNPHYVDALLYLGGYYLLNNRLEESKQVYQTILNNNPKHVSALYSLGMCYAYEDNCEKSLENFQRVYELDPHYTDVYTWLIRVYLAQPDLQCSAQIEEFLLNFLSKENLQREFIYPFLGNYLFKKFDLSEENIQLTDEKYKKIIHESLLINGLQSTLMMHRKLEIVVRQIRKKILVDSLQNMTIDPNLIEITHAIGLQSLKNEFIFPIDSEEKVILSEIQQLLLNAINHSSWQPQALAPFLMLYGMYHPVHKLAQAHKLIKIPLENWPAYSQIFLKCVLFDILQEEEYKSQIQSFGSINNRVTQNVQQQYEENPYPRWSGLYSSPIEFAHHITQNCGNFSVPEHWHGKTLKVLIAGCGTGKQPLWVAKSYRNIEVTAIDISRASLAYAMKMADYYQVKNVKFLQADILEMDQYPEKFDVIESAGVLHHMQDPLLGWHKLRSLLTANGVMNIALYSEIARQDVVYFREVIQKSALQSTREDIVQFRELLFDTPDLYAKLLNPGLADLYYLSGVRDLFFHVQESRYSIAQIHTMLEKLNLKFLAFDGNDPEILNDYRSLFPNDPYGNNILQWIQFECHNLAYMMKKKKGLMYQFWCQAND